MNSILNESFYFLRNNFKPITLFILPFLLLSILINIIGIAAPTSPIYMFLIIFYSFFVSTIYLGGFLILLDKLANNQRIVFSEIILKALSLWAPLFLSTLLSGLLVAGGVLLLFIPGIWVFLRITLAPLYVIFKGESATESIASAFRDSQPHFAKFFFSLLPFIILFIISMIMLLNFPVDNNYFSTIGEGIITEYLFVLMTIVQYRLYTLFIKST